MVNPTNALRCNVRRFRRSGRALIGIAFGGVMLLKLAPHLNQVSIVDLAAMGVLYLLVAVVGAILMMWAAVNSLTS